VDESRNGPLLRKTLTRGLTLLKPPRPRRFERVAIAAEQLARLDELDLIVARAEAFARDLLPCDESRIALAGHSSMAGSEIGWSETLRIALPAANGRRLGWMAAGRRRGPAFTADDEALFEQLARIVTLAVQAGLRAEAARAAEARAEGLLSRMSEGVAELDPRLQFISINTAAARHLHLAHPAESNGTSLWDLGPGNGAGQFGALCQTAIETNRPVWATARFLSLKRCFDLRAFPHAGGLTVFFRDVTAEREAEERLRHSRRLEAVGQLTGGVAHDVNNLLTIMLGNFETLAVRAEDRMAAASPAVARPELEADLGLAIAGLRAGESANSLIQRLLAYSRGQQEAVQPVDVAALLRSLDPLLQRTLARRIRARVKCPPDLWPALADPAELESAVLNMALNAQDAMPNGGLLEIAAENVEVDRLYAKVGGFERTGRYVMLSVLDNGAGMTQETLRRAFDPFFTTKADGTGTGLGLAMVRGFARQAGGHVIIDSEPGRGTILRIYLPQAREKAAPRPAPTPARIPAGEIVFQASGQEHVLLVEDNALVRAHAEAILANLGYRVTSAATGAEALELLGSGLSPALLFTDVTLSGGMTGTSLAKAAAMLRPGIPVLFTSGHGEGALTRDGALPPGAALLPKPFRRSDLAVAVRARLDAGRRPPPRE
jgi:signal transduction histidine kinase/CheY-like chemotaxis protein